MIRDSYTTVISGKNRMMFSEKMQKRGRGLYLRANMKDKKDFCFTHFSGMLCYKAFIIDTIGDAEDAMSELKCLGTLSSYIVLHLKNEYTICVGKTSSNWKARVFEREKLKFETTNKYVDDSRTWQQIPYEVMLIKSKESYYQNI